jgi:hypothetical protein
VGLAVPKLLNDHTSVPHPLFSSIASKFVLPKPSVNLTLFDMLPVSMATPQPLGTLLASGSRVAAVAVLWLLGDNDTEAQVVPLGPVEQPT